MSDKSINSVVYDPPHAGQLAVDYVTAMQDTANIGLKSGLCDLDGILVPFRPGNLVTVIGYTSNMKSTFMDFLAMQALGQIDRDKNEFICKVTWEQSVEEDTLGWIASKGGLSITKMARGLLNENEWQTLRSAAVERQATPLWIMGHSQQEYQTRREARPMLTMRDVARGLEVIKNDTIEGEKLRPRMIVLDYLQRIRPDEKDGGATRREQMMTVVDHAKNLAIAYNAVVVLGVQAGRGVLQRDIKLPTLDDGQETSNIEQSSDVAFSCWYPIKSEPRGSTVFDKYEVDEHLFILGLLKQKLGPAPETYALYVDPEKRTIAHRTKA
ncbi:MAG TPA: DnaB-like helicase C-terminal domain-containing protein [Anaerolineaceae bacterium]|nr:DnaB-like helicase C-terminal domain-containing protein [Anaerolineaceae bacterium]